MSFDWQRFFQNHHVDYVTSGPNVARGGLGIRCPFCGPNDPSHHMGASENNKKGWGCLRNASHRGRKPHRLIQALLRCSYAEAARIAGDRTDLPLESDATLGDRMRALLSGDTASHSQMSKLDFKSTFKLLEQATGVAKWYFDYMWTRGYDETQTAELARLYGLRYQLRGRFAYRIVFPIEMAQGLVNWTGRAIQPGAIVRYKTLTTNAAKAKREDLPPALLEVDQTLWNYAELDDVPVIDTLVVCEGPFDALKVDYFGRKHGVRATCPFGKNISEEQTELLGQLAPKCRRKLLCQDPDAYMGSFGTWTKLERFGFKNFRLPNQYEDPGAMPAEAVARLFTK